MALASSSRRGAPGAPSRSMPGEVRLIGGIWKRSKLPVVDMRDLRPTPDRLRETLFNWLGQDLSGLRCLDAFAGTGALGFEAASRGAAEVVLLERDARLVQSLRAVQARLGAAQVRIEASDALRWMAARSLQGTSFDVVLLDPPFNADAWAAALAAARPLLARGGQLYLEADRAFAPDTLSTLGYELLRHARAGQVHGHLMQAVPCPDRPS